MRKLILVLLFVPLTILAEPLDFKGIRMGDSESVVVSKLNKLITRPEAVSCGPNSNWDQFGAIWVGARQCYYDPAEQVHPEKRLWALEHWAKEDPSKPNPTLAGLTITSMRFSFNVDDKLQYIEIVAGPIESFTDVVQALIVKYGKASKVIPFKTQNSFGAVFSNTIWQWKFKEGAIESTAMPGHQQTGLVEYLSKDAKQELEKLRKRKTKDSAKDL
jgi:hypothetical protein